MIWYDRIWKMIAYTWAHHHDDRSCRWAFSPPMIILIIQRAYHWYHTPYQIMEAIMAAPCANWDGLDGWPSHQDNSEFIRWRGSRLNIEGDGVWVSDRHNASSVYPSHMNDTSWIFQKICKSHLFNSTNSSDTLSTSSIMQTQSANHHHNQSHYVLRFGVWRLGRTILPSIIINLGGFQRECFNVQHASLNRQTIFCSHADIYMQVNVSHCW